MRKGLATRKDLTRMSNVLDLYDQTYFSFGRAAGVTNLLQCVWVYDRGIDVDGLRRFHHQLQQGLLSRRIELFLFQAEDGIRVMEFRRVLFRSFAPPRRLD